MLSTLKRRLSQGGLRTLTEEEEEEAGREGARVTSL
jgi:hypothetical protein